MNATLSAAGPSVAARAAAARPAGRGLATCPLAAPVKASPSAARAPARRPALQVAAAAVRDGAKLDRKLRVAVIGGGPSGACAAETLASGGVETFLIERKLDNCKVRVGERGRRGRRGERVFFFFFRRRRWGWTL